MKLQTSLSQPSPSKSQKSTSRRHLTLPEPLNKNYSQSPAERYILSRSSMLRQSNEQQRTPSAASPTTIIPLGHSERMHLWHQTKVNEIYKKQKHRYVYGPPPTSRGFPFSSPSFFLQSNLSLTSQKNN